MSYPEAVEGCLSCPTGSCEKHGCPACAQLGCNGNICGLMPLRDADEADEAEDAGELGQHPRT